MQIGPDGRLGGLAAREVHRCGRIDGHDRDTGRGRAHDEVHGRSDRFAERAADPSAEEGVDDDRRAVDAGAERGDVAWHGKVEFRDPGVTRDPVPVPGGRHATRPRLRPDHGDDDRCTRKGEAPRGHEAVPSVVPGAAQDDDRSTPPATEVGGKRLDGGGDRGPRVLHEPLLGDAEHLSSPVRPGHPLRGDRGKTLLGGPVSSQAAQVQIEDRRVIGRQGRSRFDGGGHRREA